MGALSEYEIYCCIYQCVYKYICYVVVCYNLYMLSDICNMRIKGDVCDSDSELCCSEFFARNHRAPLGYDVLPELCGVHSLCTADCALIVR